MNINTVSSSTVKKQLYNRRGLDTKDGLLLRIHHTPQVGSKEQILRFTLATFNAAGNILAISNIRGDIYLVNLSNNKYWTLQSFTSCTVLKFSAEFEEELLVGLNGGDISIINTGNAKIKITLQKHKDSVVGVSFNTKKECLCYSKMDAILWNLRDYVKIYTVCCNCVSAIKEIVFAPTTNFIVGYDQDDIISIWDSNNYDIIKQIVPAAWDKFSLKSLAFTRNGRIMVLAGMAPQIAVYFFDVWSIVKILKLPEQCKASKKVDFIPQPFDAGSNQLLAVLGTNGFVYIYNMEKDELVTQIISEALTKRMELSSDGKFLANILETGQLFLYSLAILLNNITRADDKQLLENEPCKIILPKNSSYSIFEIKKELGNLLEIDKLKIILKEFKEYPNIYRQKIWSHLLKLPHNSNQYHTFVTGKEKHDSVMQLCDVYPLENQMAFKNVKNLISDIIFWSPFFYNVDYLPLFVFPFIEVFKNDPVTCLEAVITIISKSKLQINIKISINGFSQFLCTFPTCENYIINTLVNWCQYWFQYHPLPPLSILSMIENIFLESGGMLLSHFTRYDVSSKLYAWTLLQSTFSEVLLSKDWLLLWDHILTNELSFLLFAPVAYCLCQKNALLSLHRQEHFHQYFHQQNPIDMKKFINMIYYLLVTVSKTNHPRYYLKEFRPIGSEFYPTFDQFPSTFNQQYLIDPVLNQKNSNLSQIVNDHRNSINFENSNQIDEYEKQQTRNIKQIDMERSFGDGPQQASKFITLQIEKLSKLQEQVQSEQERLLHLSKTGKMNVLHGNSIQDEFNHGTIIIDSEYDKINKYGNTSMWKMKTEEAAKHWEKWKGLNMAINKLILKAYEQIKANKMKSTTENISRMMAETKEIQNEVEKLANHIIKYI